MAYVINLDDYQPTGAHWIALFLNGDNGSASYGPAYFDSFGFEHIPKEIKEFIGNKNIMTNIYIIQAYDLIRCRYFCIGFIDFKVNVCWIIQIYFLIKSMKNKKMIK